MKLELDYVKALVGLVSENGLSELKLESGETKISIKKEQQVKLVQQQEQPVSISADTITTTVETLSNTSSQEVGSAPVPPKKGTPVVCPMVGTYYSSPTPDSPPFVKVGEKISVGQTLCIVESMKLMNEIESEVAGTVIEVCINDAEPVDSGTVLMYIE